MVTHPDNDHYNCLKSLFATTTLDENNQIKAITVLEEYTAGKNFVKNQLFTNNTSTAVYMAVRDFEATIFEDDIRQGKIFVIKEA